MWPEDWMRDVQVSFSQGLKCVTNGTVPRHKFPEILWLENWVQIIRSLLTWDHPKIDRTLSTMPHSSFLYSNALDDKIR